MQVPSPAADGSKERIPCNFNGMSGKRLSLEIDEAVAVSTAISVEYEDALFLGEVVGCARSDQGWSVQVQVEQILTGLQSLMALRAHLVGESVPQPLSLLPLGARN